MENLKKQRRCNKFGLNREVLRSFFIILIVMLTSISMVSSFEFDNVKSYDQETKTATIKNSILGVPTTTIATIKLDTPQVNYVMRGPDRLVAQMTIDNKGNYNNVFNDLKFYNIKDNMNQFDRKFVYRYKTYEDYQVINYKEVCEYSEVNKTEECNSIKDGTKTYQRAVWNKFDSKSQLPKGIITIGIFTDVYSEDNVEWIPKLFNIEIEEWAVWTESLNIGITSYFDFNGTGTNLPNLVNASRNGTASSTPMWVTHGIIGNASNFSEDYFFNISEEVWNTGGDNSVSFWINVSNSVSANRYIFSTGDDSGIFGGTTESGGLGTDTLQLFAGAFDTGADDIGPILNRWIHVVIVQIEGGNVSFYLNGTLWQTGLVASSVVASKSLVIGSIFNGAGKFSGLIDEFAIWNRTLSSTEVTQLYNGGVGITFIEDFPVQVTLTSPANNSLFQTDDIIQFQANHSTTTSTLVNSTLQIWNSSMDLIGTNFTNITGSNNQTSLTFDLTTEEVFHWNYFSCTVASCGFALNNRTITISQIIENELTFNVSTFETASEQFQLNITAPTILSADSFLNYNGTRFKGSANCEGETCLLSNIIDIPLIDKLSENKTFFWELTLFNGTDSVNVNTTKHQQNVSQIFLEDCGGDFTVEALNFTAFDEENLTSIDPFDFDASFEIWLGSGSIKKETNVSNMSVSSLDLCIDPSDRNFFINGQIEYDQSGVSNYTQRNYFFQNNVINDSSQAIKLGLLLSSSSTSFILAVQDEFLLPVPNILIFTERFYPGLDTFKIVQVAKTDDNGRSVGFFKTETADYRFIIKRNNTNLLETNQQKIIPESSPFTLTFTLGEDSSSAWAVFEPLDDLEQNLIFNKTSVIVSFTYIDSSVDFSFATLIVEKLRGNDTNLIICNFTSVESSAIIICNLTGNQTGLYSARAIISRSGVSELVAQLPFQIEDFSSVVGDLGLFLGWLIILTSAFAFTFNEIAGIWMVTFSMFAVNFFGLIAFGAVFLTGILAVAIIITVVIER